jgi:hypothetical protein
MIKEKLANHYLSNNLCYHCGLAINEKVKYYIWATRKDSISIKVAFHKKCFLSIAGDQYMFHRY